MKYITNYMTDYNYIVEQCKNDSEDAWNEESVKNCILHLESLSDKELHDLLFEKEVQDLGLAKISRDGSS